SALPPRPARSAAILAGGIAGYRRRMGEGEARTVRDLKGHQAGILPLVGRYGGRIIDTAGDGILAEFPSVIKATECAVEIQTIMATRNEVVPELLKTGNCMTHLEYDLESLIWRHLYRELAKDYTLVRYDARGNGLSDRTVDDISFEAFVSDLESGRRREHHAVRAARDLPRLRDLDRLRRAPPRAGVAS